MSTYIDFKIQLSTGVVGSRYEVWGLRKRLMFNTWERLDSFLCDNTTPERAKAKALSFVEFFKKEELK